MSKLEINIPMTPTQRAILNDKHRFKVVCCGRQFGKSHFAAGTAIILALTKPNSRIWIISPTYRQSGYLFDKVVELCRQNNVPINVKKSNLELVITFTTNGSTFQALSGDSPDKLRGATLSYLIVDEAAMIDDEIWTKHLRAMLAVQRAPVLFLSTPKGKNWFFDLYQLGLGDNPAWKSFHYSSYDGIICANDTEEDHPGRDELDRIKVETDEVTWRQEYEAEFIEGGGQVFGHWKTEAIPRKPEDGHTYIAGLDLAKHVDFTVLTVYDIDSLKPIDYLRMSELDWSVQIPRIKEFLNRYHNPRVYCDSTGVGDAIVERMRVEERMDVVGIVFSAKQKQQMIQNLAVMLNNEEITVPDDKVFIDELERYAYTQSTTGNFRYSAPPNYHDDCVCSLALVAWGISKLAKDVGFYQEDVDSNDDWKLNDFEWDDVEEFDWSQPSEWSNGPSPRSRL